MKKLTFEEQELLDILKEKGFEGQSLINELNTLKEEHEGDSFFIETIDGLLKALSN